MRRIFATLFGLLLLSGCTGLAPVASGSMSSTANLGVHITLADGKADPSGERVEAAKGTTLVLTIDSDRDDEVHVHGYDIGEDVEAGGEVEFDFPADIDGVFEVELESSATQIAELTVNP